MTVTNGQRERTTEREGPFQAPRLHEHPWQATETERGPFERRRSGERRAPGAEPEDAAGASAADVSDRRRRWGRRKSDVLNAEARQTLTGRSRQLARRFKEPLIGLTLAGVAAPLINATVVTEDTPGPAPEAEPGEAAAAAAAAEDLDSEVGNVWAESEEAMVREQTIDGAVTRYGIDRTLSQQIYDAATRHDIEPDIAYGLVFTESTFRERAVSHVGARGLTQLMPNTARWLDPTLSMRDLFDPEKNLDTGFRYLRDLIDKYDGNVENALTAYNRGPGTVDRILKRGGNPDNGYAGKVLAG